VNKEISRNSQGGVGERGDSQNRDKKENSSKKHKEQKKPMINQWTSETEIH
jgi:hypothetical protein